MYRNASLVPSVVSLKRPVDASASALCVTVPPFATERPPKQKKSGLSPPQQLTRMRAFIPENASFCLRSLVIVVHKFPLTRLTKTRKTAKRKSWKPVRVCLSPTPNASCVPTSMLLLLDAYMAIIQLVCIVLSSLLKVLGRKSKD